MTKLSSLSARKKLPCRRAPYFEPKVAGHSWSIGYKKNDTHLWLLRWRDEIGRYRFKTLGSSEEVAGGMSYKEALESAKDAYLNRLTPENRLVRHNCDYAFDFYLNNLLARGKAIDTAHNHIHAYLSPDWGSSDISTLDRRSLLQWRDEISQRPPRVRSFFNHEGQKYNEEYDPNDIVHRRKRRSSVNRLINTFKAALNLYAKHHPNNKCDPIEWKYGLESFKQVDRPRQKILTQEQIPMLINACEPDFRQLVQAALLTGCRYSELTHLKKVDIKFSNNSLYISDSKSGNSRHVILSDEGLEFFTHITHGMSYHENVFKRSDGKCWGRSHTQRRMEKACSIAGIEYINFHQLRHTYASLCLMNGLQPMILADNLGHSDTRMIERNYGHLTNQFKIHAIKNNAPNIGFKSPEHILSFKKNANSHR